MYISLSMDPYKYVVITSMRRISSPSGTTKLIKKRNVIVFMTGEYVPRSQYQISTRNLVLLITLYILWSHYSHCVFVQILICTQQVLHLQVYGLQVQKLLILLMSLTLPAWLLSILANHFYVGILPHFVVQDLHNFLWYWRPLGKQKYC